ncbi:MAG: 2,5-diketo-D-gluconate reductase B [Verrucomicrobiales bacterium]|jgi:2,5-diketo-D-gluconate reductase B
MSSEPTSLDIPSIGLGTLKHLGDAARDLVALAIADGYRHIDTAEYYGNEEPVGEGIRSSSVPRDDLWVTTKILHPKATPPTGVRAAAEASLKRLGLEYVDALLIHWPNDYFEFEHELEVFAELRDSGLTRTIGVSNFPSALLRSAVEIDPGIIMNQVEFHPFISQSAVMEVAAEAGVLVSAHTPLARGAVVENEVLIEIAASHDTSPAQVALAWVLRHDGVIAIPGASSVAKGAERQRERLRENLAATELALSDDEMARISSVEPRERIVDGPHAPDWDS